MTTTDFVPCPHCGTANSPFNPACVTCRAPTVERPTVAVKVVDATPTRRIPALAAGTRIGAYVVERTLGSGSTGVVVEASRSDTSERFALKVVPATLFRSNEVALRFEREGALLARLSHPRIVRLVEIVRAGDAVAVVLELVCGVSFEHAIAASRGGLPLRMILRQAAEGLVALHAAGIVHRDLKPSNILIRGLESDDCAVKLVDLGLARAVEAQMGSYATAIGQVVGTLAYTAPEVVLGDPASSAADLWSLGVCAYEAIAGARPFVGPTRAALATAIISFPPKPPMSPSASDLGDLVMALLDKDPERRPNAADVVKALPAV